MRQSVLFYDFNNKTNLKEWVKGGYIRCKLTNKMCTGTYCADCDNLLMVEKYNKGRD